MKFANPATEVLGAAVTFARYPIAEYMAYRVRHNKSILIPGLVSVIADIYDGALLRRFDMDTPFRRIMDGLVDHAVVGRVSLEVGKRNSAALPYLGIIAARAAFAAGALNGTHLLTTGEVTKGRKKQKATHLTTALFGLTASTGNRPLTHTTGLIAAGVAVLTTPAHFKNLGYATGGVYREL